MAIQKSIFTHLRNVVEYLLSGMKCEKHCKQGLQRVTDLRDQLGSSNEMKQGVLILEHLREQGWGNTKLGGLTCRWSVGRASV